MNHLVLSPHADDAVASCGGTIAHLVGAGADVTIHTIFCRPVAPPYSPCASELHRLWGAPRDVVRLRRAEDEAAAARLGARLEPGDHPEAIYRRDRNGEWLYPDDERIFGLWHAQDSTLLTELAQSIRTRFELADTRVYAPLGIGRHVDHLLVFEAANALRQAGHDVVFYEDFPYAARASGHALRMAELQDLRATTVAFGEDELLAKIEAFSYYRSQIEMLFGGHNAMPSAFVDYARTVAGADGRFGERYWFYPDRAEPPA